jgi:hypothetical protein
MGKLGEKVPGGPDLSSSDIRSAKLLAATKAAKM